MNLRAYLVVSALLDKILGKNEGREHTNVILARLHGKLSARGAVRDEFIVCGAVLP